MAKPIAKRRHDEAERAFRKAWKLLDRIERRLERARAQERKRLGQLADGAGREAPRRLAQLAAARTEIAQIEGLLTELSELIAGNARASSGQTVKDMAASVAAEIKDEAAEPPQLPTRGRNRHHRPRRKPAEADGTVATATTPASIDLPAPAGAASVGQSTTAGDAESESPTSTSKPAPVIYRSLISHMPDTRRPNRPAREARVPAAADPAREEPTSDGGASPGPDRDDPSAEGA